MRKRPLVLGLLLCAVVQARGQQWEPLIGAWGCFPNLSMDPQGNVHMIYARDSWDARYARYDAATGTWSQLHSVPGSLPLNPIFGKPRLDVGGDGIPHVVWSTPSLGHMGHAWADTTAPQGPEDWQTEFIALGWVAFPDVAVDSQGNPHYAYQKVTHNPDTWHLIYRDAWGAETVIQWDTDETYKPNFPTIEWGAGCAHIAWEKGDGDHGNIYYANSSDWGNIWAMSNTSYAQHPSFVQVAVSPVTGTAGVTYFIDDWTSGWGYHLGVYFSQPGGAFQQQLWSCYAWVDDGNPPFTEDGWPMIDYDNQGTRYVAWTIHDPSYDAAYYKVGEDPEVELPEDGHIDVAAGVNGAMMARAKPSGGQIYWCHLGGGVYYPPTAVIDSIVPNPAYQQQDVVSFYGSAWDNDEGGQSITAYEWSSDKDGFLSNAEDFQRSADNLSLGQHVITFKVWDNENQTDQTTAPLTISQLYPPTARIDSITPNPATQQIDVVHFEGSAWDNDEGGQSIVGYQWSSSLDGPLGYTEDFDRYAADLSAGAHLITFEVFDDDNQSAQDTLTLVVYPPPQPPTAVIDSITPNPAVQVVDTVAFYGSAWDNDENGQSIISYRWTSDVAGILSNQEDFSVPATGLSVGPHLITFKVWDDESQTAQDTMTIVIDPSPFLPPTAVIDSIVPQVAYQEVDTVSFYGSAWDNDENGQAIEAYEWSSDLDGIIGGLEDVWLPADSLSVGEHLVTLQVWDDEGQTAQDTMTLAIEPSPYQPPTAVIDSIVPDSSYYGIDTVYFYGSAWDNDENGQSIEACRWSSSLDGELAIVTDFFLPADSLSVGNHLITFTVWDDEQQTAQDTMTVVVLDPGSVPPTAVIDSIQPSPAMQQRDTLSFFGSAWDNDPTDIIEAYQWWSSRLGKVLSEQEDFLLPADSLPLGLNAIRFTAWDNEGDSAMAWGSVAIVPYVPTPPTPQQVLCEYQGEEDRVKLTWIGPMAATFNVYHDSLAYFTGVDPVASGLAAPPWYHENPDLTRPHFYYVTSENLGGESEPSERVGLMPYDTGP